MMIEQFSNFQPQSRVWVYASERMLRQEEITWLEAQLQNFTQSWTAHEIPLKAAAAVLHKHFVVLMVDENTHPISGCGIDKSVKLMKEAGERLGINFFNRMAIQVANGDKIKVMDFQRLKMEIETQSISLDAKVFNNLVQTKEELEKAWLLPLSQSWVGKRLTLPL
jgi:hypothetical protein